MTKSQWLAIARDALIRSGLRVDNVEHMTKDIVKLNQGMKDKAFDRLNYLEFQIENGKTK